MIQSEVKCYQTDFQPFLRFYRSRLWNFCVFKFFFGFLFSRGSLFRHALHSKQRRRVNTNMPFFAASHGQRPNHAEDPTPFFGVVCCGWGSGCVAGLGGVDGV